ncbi:recombinase family protein [Variovorax sp. DXTD-1]|uniref:recombinase family protein n=1 Tax=Variovorax sp. DXTD-1 TaxID=2495592 RepID=UPI000F871C53|nr:recombinase family protein [Variovorax sp. DXTD-1]RST50543.1 recombinase family protein [Variovorax sp. DXTD-1]
MLIGYARVSTTDQETRLQRDALRAAGVTRIYQEKGSGVGPRPELHRVLATLQPGDVLVVWKLDRLARSMKQLWDVVDRVKARGAGFRSLTEPIDTSTPLGEFVLSVLGALAQFERSLIRERSVAGQVAAMRRGVRWGGRKPALAVREVSELLKLWDTGLFTMQQLGEGFGVSRSTVSNYLNPRGPRQDRKRLPVLGAYLSASDE